MITIFYIQYVLVPNDLIQSSSKSSARATALWRHISLELDAGPRLKRPGDTRDRCCPNTRHGLNWSNFLKAATVQVFKKSLKFDEQKKFFTLLLSATPMTFWGKLLNISELER